MSKHQNGNKEAKKPKRAQPAIPVPGTAPAVTVTPAPARQGGKR